MLTENWAVFTHFVFPFRKCSFDLLFSQQCLLKSSF